MFNIKFFSKSELVEWLTAAGLTAEEVQKMATLNLRNKISASQGTIAENKAIIQNAEVAIAGATTELKSATNTLKIANKMGG